MTETVRSLASELRRPCVMRVILVALVLRVAILVATLVLHPSGIWSLDSEGYWIRAENLVDHGAFSEQTAPPWKPDHRRTPGYPLFLAPFTVIPSGPVLAVLLQSILGSLVAGLVTVIALHRGTGSTAATVAGLIIALDVPSISMTAVVMAETLFTVLLVGALLIQLREPGRAGLFAVGALAGLAILTRPAGILLPLVAVGVELMRPTRRWTSAAMVAAGVILVVAPWIGRNVAVYGSPFLSTVGIHNLLHYRAAGVLAVRDSRPITEMRAELVAAAFESYPGDPLSTDPADELAFKRWQGAKGLEVMREEPLLVVENHLRAMAAILVYPQRGEIDRTLGLRPETTVGVRDLGGTAGGSYLDRFLSMTSPFTIGLLAVQLGMTMVVLSLAGIGLVVTWRRRAWRELLLLGGPILCFLAVCGGPEAGARFRVPLMPYLGVLAGIGVAPGIRRWRARASRRHGRQITLTDEERAG